MVAQKQADRLWTEWRSFDDDFAADERVGDAPLDVADDAALQHDRMLDLAAGQVAIGTDRREWADIRVTHRCARSDDGGAAHRAGGNRSARFDDNGPNERRF